MTHPKGRKREPITEAREAEIITLIDEWNPKKAPFSREALVRRVEETMGLVFSRQGLMKRDLIRAAFARREKEIKATAKPRGDKEPLAAVLERRVEELQVQVKKQAKLIEEYEKMFLTYRYNARQRGVTRDQLEAQIPPRHQPEGSSG